MSIEAMKLMVDELEYVLDCINNEEMPFDGDDFHEALRMGRQAIAEAEKQEPVKIVEYICVCGKGMRFESVNGVIAPKREWVGLTDEDKQIAFDDTQEASGGFWEFADAIEAKLKEKNT